MKNQKRFKQIVEGFLISLMIALFLVIIDRLEQIDFLNGAGKSELEKVNTPAPVLDSGNVTDGIILTHEYKINDQTVQEQKKIITKEIRIEQDALLEVIAYSYCKLSDPKKWTASTPYSRSAGWSSFGTPSHKRLFFCFLLQDINKKWTAPTYREPGTGCCRNERDETKVGFFCKHYPGGAVVISKIYLDGIELTKDSCSSTIFTDWIASTAVLQKNVEAGKHQIKVEGIYCGYDSNTHIQSKMNFSIHRTKRAPIELSYHQSMDEDKDICKLPAIIPFSPGNTIEGELSDQIGGEK